MSKRLEEQTVWEQRDDISPFACVFYEANPILNQIGKIFLFPAICARIQL